MASDLEGFAGLPGLVPELTDDLSRQLQVPSVGRGASPGLSHGSPPAASRPADPVNADHQQGIASGEAPVQAVPALALVRAGVSGDADVPVDVVPLDAGLAEP